MDRFFDSHCHLSDERVFNHPLKTGGAVSLCRPEEWKEAKSCLKTDMVCLAALHPWYVNDYNHSVLDDLEALLKKNPGLYIGETGLDGSKNRDNLKVQIDVFTRHLKLAQELNRPVCIHCVHAWGELIKTLKSLSWTDRFFYVHSFSGSLEIASALIRRGGWISFSPGMLGPDNVPGKKTERVFKGIPIGRMLIETDLPYNMTLSRFNEFISWCSKALNISPDTFIQKMNINSQAFFSKKKSDCKECVEKTGASDLNISTPVWYDRTLRLIGREAMNILESSSVMIAGLGAVGGSALEAVVRSGVGRVILVDFDKFDLTNINRQILALGDSIGKSKVEVAAKRVKLINPKCQVVIEQCFINPENVESLLKYQPDIIIDAIDAVNSKTAVIEAAYRRGIRCFSSMGAALRTDPCAVRFGPLSEITNDRLARIIRKRLRKRGVSVEFPCVYSIESQEKVKTALHLNSLEHDLKTFQGPDTAFSSGRARMILGSLPTIPAIFGNTLANMVIMDLIS